MSCPEERHVIEHQFGSSCDSDCIIALVDIDCVIALMPRPMKNTISGSEARAFMKILVDPATDKLLGMLMAGPECAEIIQVGVPLKSA